jgi:hypothetical protein
MDALSKILKIFEKCIWSPEHRAGDLQKPENRGSDGRK